MRYCLHCESFGHSTVNCPDRPLEQWEIDLLQGLNNDDIRVQDVKVVNFNGESVLLKNILWESNRMEDGFLVMEDEDSNVFHFCNAAYWQIP